MIYAKKVKDIGLKIYIEPSAKALHYWGESTKKSASNIKKIFTESRFYYFKKNYGLLSAICVSYLLGISKSNLILFGIVLIGGFFRFYNLGSHFSLIPDQKWFYSSATQLILKGKIPLLGITSSQTWLHQGPLWTYLLAPILLLFNFNSVSGAYLTAVMGVFSILMIYKVGRVINENVGLIAGFLYATSPVIIQSDIFPYHTSPIPLAVLFLIFSLTRWTLGNLLYFPIALFCMSILYNLELATVVFWPVILLLLTVGFLKQKPFVLKLFTPRLAFLSLLLLLIPMIPVLIYDVNHGFVQTAKYANWTIYYKILKPMIEGKHNIQASINALLFLSKKSESLFLIRNQIISSAVSLFAIIAILKSRRKEDLVIVLCTIIPAVGFVFNGVLSDAYIPMLFP